MKKIYTFILAVILIGIFSINANAQTLANYTFSSTTTGSLDPMTGATSFVGSSGIIAGYNDDNGSAVTNIGFTFYFMGTPYTQFSVNSNGQMRLGSTVVGGSNITTFSAGVPILAPMAADNSSGFTGDTDPISYLVSGTAPNRILKVQWKNFQIPFNSSGTTAGNMQVWLYEASGKIDYIYGSMYNNSLSAASRSIFLASSNTATTGGYITVGASPTFTLAASPVTNSFAAASNIANLYSSADGSRRTYSFTPLSAPTAPTNLTFTAITGTSYTLNWTDNSSNETGFGVWKSTDGGVTYNYVGSAAANATTFPITGLNFGVTYYWQVAAINEGAASTYLSGSQATTSPTLSGTKYVGTGANTMDYATLTDAFTAINSNGLSGNLSLVLNTTYTTTDATFPIAGPSAGAVGSYNVNIYPSVTGLSITSSSTTGAINLNGSKNIIFDGRVGGTGSTKDLTISNTSTTGYTVQFINDAVYNTIKYCKVLGVSTSTSGGVVVFSTTTGTTGNDNNTIDNCDLRDGATTPTNIIYSSGTTTTTALNNSNNTISNNNIYNFYNSTSTSNAGIGINIAGGNTDWTISGNSFYQTATRTIFGASATMNAILIGNSSGNNFSITGNYIGGTAPVCGGTAFTLNAATTLVFRGIQLTVGTTTPTSIQGNTIQNIAITSTSTSSAQSLISLVTGSFNCGNITGNTLGSQSATGSVAFTTSGSAAIFTALICGTGTPGVINISNNTVGGIAVTVSGAPLTGTSVRGIGVQGAATSYVISNNIIGSTTTANSFTSTTNSSLLGIFSASTSTTNTISGNIVANLTHNGTGTSAQLIGILEQGSSGGAFTTTSNIVRNLTSVAPNVGTSSAASVIGISHTAATTAGQTISQNTIYGLSNTNTTAANFITGIHYAGPTSGTNVVSKNLIHSLSLSTTSATADMRGINFASGLANVQNNMIRLGIDASGNAVPNGNTITGLYDVVSTTGTGMYFNSIYIGGSGIGTQTGNSYSFRSDQTTNTRTYQNNIFFNARSNATTGGKHYAIRVAGTTPNPAGLALNYNDYIVTGTGGVFGYFNLLDVASLAAWKTAVGQDANSINGDPQFISPTSGTPDLHIHATNPTPIEGTGLSVAAVTDDYDGQTRSGLTPTDIGADAGNFVGNDIAPPSISYTVLGTSTSTTTRSFTNVTITDGSGINTTSGTRPRVYYKKSTNANTFNDNTNATDGWKWAEANGTSSPFDFTIDYSLISGGTVAAGDNIQYFVVAQDLAAIPNIGINSGSFAAAPTSVALTSAAFPLGGTINSYQIVAAPMAGSYTVGSALFNKVTGLNLQPKTFSKDVEVEVPVYTEITNKEGKIETVQNGFRKETRKQEYTEFYKDGKPYKGELYAEISKEQSSKLGINTPKDAPLGVYPTISAAVNDLNLRGVSGAVTFVLVDASYSGETLPITINVVTGASATNTITIKPNTGINATITGSSATSIFKLNGADYVTIDGSNNGTNTKNLTITNSSTAASTASIWLSSLGTGAGATYNTIKNCNINAGIVSTATTYGLFLGGASIGTAGDDNDYNTIQNNNIGTAYLGIYAQATGLTGADNNLSILQNSIGSATDANSVGNVGIQLAYVTNSIINQNTIFNLKQSTTPKGIYISTSCSGLNIDRNSIYTIKYTGTSGYGGWGIHITPGIVSSNITVSNNVIYDLGGDGWSSITGSSMCGLVLDGSSGGINVYYNSINLTGNYARSTATITASVFINSSVTSVDMRNNIFSNSMVNTTTASKSYSIYSFAANTAFTQINYNDYFPSGTQQVLGYLGADQTTLALWKTATGKDVNSVSGDPKFKSTTDLHIDPVLVSPVSNAGTYIASVLTDYDGDTRSLTTPDIGMDEYIYIVPTVGNPSAFTATAAGPTLINLAWTNNPAGDNVMLVYNTTNTFGVPADGITYAVTEEVPGGGTVLYIGLDGVFAHSGLTPTTPYYYKAYSVDGSTMYSPGVSANATTLTPTITVTPVSLAFGYTPSGGTSTEKTYSITATNLTPASGNLTITPPANFEVSLTTGTGFSSTPITVAYTGGALSATTIYAIFKPTAPGTNYTGNIVTSGGSADLKNVAVTGSSILSYCASIPSNTADEEIFSVTVNGATNAYNCTTVAPGPGSILNRYSNFYPLGNLTNLSQGYTVSFTILEDECDGPTYYSNGCAIWIDYNQNGIFEEPGEKVFVETTTTTSPRTITGSFVVPGTATLGQTGMRIIVAEGISGTGLTPCMTYSYGETEDYYVNIIVPTGPSNPVSFTPTASSSSQIDLAFAPNASTNPVVIVWNADGVFTTPSGAPPSVGSPFAGGTLLYNGTSSPQNHTGLISGTKYYYKAFSYDGTLYSGGLTGDATTFCALAPLPFAQSFDAVTFPPSCWALINAGTGNQWTRSTTTPYAGLGVMVYNYNSSAAANAWSFTPGFNLQTGKVYKLGFYQKVASATWPEKMKVTVGLDQTVAAQTTTLWDNAGGTELSNTTYMLRNADFTCTSTGTYYFAFNCYSDADMFNLFVDEVTIMEQPAIDLAFTQFYQNSGLPTPSLKNGEKFSDYNVTMSKPKIKEGTNKIDKNGIKIKNVEHERQFVTFDKNAPGVKGLIGIDSKITPINPIIPTASPNAFANINLKAQVTNLGINAATYLLDWNVSGVSQTQHSGPSVSPGTSDLADLTFTPTAIGTFLTSGNITVTGDEVAGNNTATPFRMRVYPELFTRTINDRGNNVIDTYIGWGSSTAMTAGVRFTSTDAVKLAGVDFIYRTETVTSGTVTIKVRAAGTATTAPGPVLYTKTYNTADYIPPGDGGAYIFFPFDASAPTIAAATDYWITIESPTGILYPGGAQSSGFVAGRSFYESTPGGDVWSALVLTSVEYAWVMRSVNKPVSTLSLTALLQGFYDGTTMVSDTVTVELRHATTFALIDQSRAVLNSSGVGTATFTNAANSTPYYIVIKHRNALETWSATTQQFTSYSLAYDFTSAVTQAYGSNLVLVGTKYCLYVGDENRDGTVDLLDLIDIDNDNANFVTGYVVTDLNGDLSVDLLDLIICDNNNANFITAIKPPGAPTLRIIRTPEQLKAIEFYKNKMEQYKKDMIEKTNKQQIEQSKQEKKDNGTKTGKNINSKSN